MIFEFEKNQGIIGLEVSHIKISTHHRHLLSVNILYNLTLKVKLNHVPYGSTLILECNFSTGHRKKWRQECFSS